MTRYLYAAAVAAIGLGIVLVYLGVLSGSAFVPGTMLVALGLVLAAVAGMIDVFTPQRSVD
jgi:hypothetical protein